MGLATEEEGRALWLLVVGGERAWRAGEGEGVGSRMAAYRMVVGVVGSRMAAYRGLVRAGLAAVRNRG